VYDFIISFNGSADNILCVISYPASFGVQLKSFVSNSISSSGVLSGWKKNLKEISLGPLFTRNAETSFD